MRALFLRTYTPDCEKFWLSLGSLGPETFPLQYDDIPHERHDELVGAAKHVQPDVIIFLGALEKFHLKPVPKVDILHKFRAIAPMIHICSDASDWPWWDTLNEYDKEGCFDLQVNVDGSDDCPIAGFRNGMIKLTPTDPAFFKPKPWEERDVFCGVTGGMGHDERAELITYITASPDVRWMRKVPYQDMCDFMCRCMVSINHAMNGTGDKFHVKGRVIEAGWAGSCLLEKKNPHTARWFLAGKEYIEYDNVKDAVIKLEWAKAHPQEIRDVAERFHAKMWAFHHPSVFWKDVLGKIGLSL